MDKRVILAVAGSGKTYYICNHIDITKKNLILAYTHENITNIINELTKSYGRVPELTSVMTFDAFINRLLLKPYEPSIFKHFHCEGAKSNGITMMKPPTRTIPNGKRNVPNPQYKKKSEFEHYITQSGFYYCDNLAELILEVKCDGRALVKDIIATLNLFYDEVLIDEFQDYREKNYDLLMALVKGLNHVLLVGDYYQHSVSGRNNSGKPFAKKGKEISFQDFIKEMEANHLTVDTKSLKTSRRCGKEICDYIKATLGIDITSEDNHPGKIIFVDDADQAKAILLNDNIVKLLYRNASKYAERYSIHAMNWSYSKGDTFTDTCVILTGSTDSMFKNYKQVTLDSSITRNRLYVALTRSKHDTYIISSDVFQGALKSINVSA
ncbi:MAG: UvrD-helicase domain-containing protein [Eubacterium sp.]